MKFLLDTDTFTALARGLHTGALAHAERAGLDNMALSVVTEAEVRYGQAHQAVSAALAQRIDIWLQQLHRLSLGHNVVQPYAELRSTLRRLGQPIGPNDLWIAAHALALGLTLVTGNEREFSRVKGLKVVNWLR